MNTIGWFFFRLFIIGYVEDPVSGKSFSLPRGLSLEIYVEVYVGCVWVCVGVVTPPLSNQVPSLNDYSDSESLEMFQNQMPTLKILGKEHKVPSSIPYAVDNEVQLVCRYLNALKTKKVAKKGEHNLGGVWLPYQQQIYLSSDTTLVDFKCHTLLEAYIPENMKSNKFLQKLFIKYITLHYITLHHTTSHYITSHYITLHHITSHYITLHHTTSHYITLHRTTSHYITSHYITLHHITSHYITLHHITSHYIALHHITLHHITSHYITLHHITSHYITLHHITLHHIHHITSHYIRLHIHL